MADKFVKEDMKKEGADGSIPDISLDLENKIWYVPECVVINANAENEYASMFIIRLAHLVGFKVKPCRHHPSYKWFDDADNVENMWKGMLSGTGWKNPRKIK
jgi:hypothetical protein